MESEKFDGMTEEGGDLLAKQMGNSLVGQMEQLRKASEELCKAAMNLAKPLSRERKQSWSIALLNH